MTARPATWAERSSARGSMTCRRLKASSWRVSRAARAEASWISSKDSRDGSPAGRSSSASEVLVVMAVSRLLKS